jgi:hypothetical protein
MNLTMLRKSLAIFSDFLAETPYSLYVLAVDKTSEPKDFLLITVPTFTLGSVDPSALSKQGGGRTRTIAIPTTGRRRNRHRNRLRPDHDLIPNDGELGNHRAFLARLAVGRSTRKFCLISRNCVASVAWSASSEASNL